MLKSTLRAKENMAIDHTAEGYIEESVNNKLKTSKMIFFQRFSSTASKCQGPPNTIILSAELQSVPAYSHSSPSEFHQSSLSFNGSKCIYK